jgi:uncharacterized Tic20 family protein
MTDPLQNTESDQQTAPVSTTAPPLSERDAEQWAAFAHLGGVVGFLPSLFIYLVLRQRSAKVASEAVEALGWQLTWLPIYLGVAVIGIFASLTFNVVGSFVFSSLLWLIYLFNVVLSIVAFVKTKDGGSYRYPVNFRWVKERV